MREILFRAKKKDNGEWVEGLPGYDINGNITELEAYMSFCDCRTYEIDPDTLCQNTGLTDKNGKKIWENDILELSDEEGYFKCEWEEETARFVLIGDWLIADFDNYWSYKSEAIGNIFDDPELLEGEE